MYWDSYELVDAALIERSNPVHYIIKWNRRTWKQNSINIYSFSVLFISL